MYFRRAVIIFCSTFPHPKIGGSVCSFDVVNEILHKSHFIPCVNYLQPRCDHFNQKYQVEGNNVNLFKYKNPYIDLWRLATKKCIVVPADDCTLHRNILRLRSQGGIYSEEHALKTDFSWISPPLEPVWPNTRECPSCISLQTGPTRTTFLCHRLFACQF